MLKKFKLSSFGGGILAGGIVVCVANLPAIFQGESAPGMLAGIALIVIGTILYQMARKKDTEQQKEKDASSK